MMSLLAYGGFDFASPDGDRARTISHLLSVVFLVLWAYAPSSLFVQLVKRWRFLGLPLFLFISALTACQLRVMGEYGPAHVAVEVGILAYPAFFLALIVKVAVLATYSKRQGITALSSDAATMPKAE